MVFGFENHKPNPKRTHCRLWLWSAWVPHGETKVEDQMVVIGLKIGEGFKLVDVDVVGLKILDHWFEFSFGSLGFKSQIVVGICFLGYMFSNRGSLWVYVFLGFKSRILADFWVYVFFTNFWVCVFFFVFG